MWYYFCIKFEIKKIRIISIIYFIKNYNNNFISKKSLIYTFPPFFTSYTLHISKSKVIFIYVFIRVFKHFIILVYSG